MGTLCEIPLVRFPREPNPSKAPGELPVVKWLAIDQLRIERSYQREILKSGLANIRHIIEEFRWTRFAPLVVSHRGGEVYAVVDGQHRAAAARFLGINSLPCQIISCSIEEEARAFAAINGNVTKLSPLQVFHARLVAGDRKAKLLQGVVEAAGCEVPRNVQLCERPGMTLAIGTLQSCLSKYGDEVLSLSLRMVVETGGGQCWPASLRRYRGTVRSAGGKCHHAAAARQTENSDRGCRRRQAAGQGQADPVGGRWAPARAFRGPAAQGAGQRIPDGGLTPC